MGLSRRVRAGILTAIVSGLLGVGLSFGDTHADPTRFALLLIYWVVSAFTIWGVSHYRSIVVEQRRISRRQIEEEEYRKLLIAELQHRLKNKVSTLHAVLHQALSRPG